MSPERQEAGFVPDEFIAPNNPDYKSGEPIDLDDEAEKDGEGAKTDSREGK